MQRCILVVDDQPTFRVGLRHVLEDLPDVATLVEAGSQAQALERLGGTQAFDLVIYDWNLCDGGSVRGLSSLMQQAPDTPVIVMCNAEDEATRWAARKLGAFACVCRSVATSVLRDLVANALVATRLWAGRRRANGEPAPRVAAVLTARQAEVLRHLVNGESNKEISRHLGISSLTVRTHVARIMSALDAHNRTQAAIVAAELGLVDGLVGPRR